MVGHRKLDRLGSGLQNWLFARKVAESCSENVGLMSPILESADSMTDVPSVGLASDG